VQIGEVAKPIILDWVIAQNPRILEWTGRVFDLEVGLIRKMMSLKALIYNR
jgi:hypothetical protein